MLQVTDLKKSFGAQVLLDGVSFQMNRGERLGLVGRNGQGKTTLFKMIIGQELPDEGKIAIPRGYKIGHLSQQANFSRATILEEACAGLPADQQDQFYRAEAVLFGLGFTKQDSERKPSEISGGFHLRLALTKVLVSDPELLLLDEPTNYLDIVSLRWLRRFLRGWRKELILITHDREFMDSVSTHTMAIHRQRVRKVSGSTEKLYEQLLQEEELYENTRRNVEAQRRHMEAFVNRFRAQAGKATLVQSRLRAMEKLPDLEELSDLRSLDFKFNDLPFAAKRMMDVEGLAFQYPPRDDAPPPSALFSELGFTVDPKDRIAVVGQNGRGKSTLLKLLAGELHSSVGTVKTHPAARIGYFGQTNIDRLSAGNTIEEEVQAVNPTLGRTQVRSICGIMMFDGDLAEKKIAVLSGGERSRVLLAKLLAAPSNLLLLDEPTSHLDMESVEALVESIGRYAGAVVIVTHSEMILKAVATKLVVFEPSGVVIFDGTYEEFLERRGWEEEAQDTETAGPSRLPGARKEAEVAISRKEQKALRAKLVTERAAILNPLKKRMEELESEITRLEGQVEADNQALIAAAQDGAGEKISALSISLARAKARIDELFDELEIVTTGFEKTTAEYEQKMRDVS